MVIILIILLKKSWFPIKQDKIKKGTELFNKYGKWSLLFMGAIYWRSYNVCSRTLRFSFIPFIILVSIGKVGRYLVIYISILWAIKFFNMEISSQIIILIIGFVFGSGVVGIFYYFNNSKKL